MRVFTLGLLLSVVGGGCGEEPDPSLPGAGDTNTAPAARSEPSPRDVRRPPRSAPDDAAPPRYGPDDPTRRAVRTPGGGVIFLPKRPTQTSTAPGQGCVASRPPKPGLRAEREGRDRVRVHYRFSTTPARCIPTQLLVTLDVNDDGDPGSTITEHLEGQLRGSVLIEVPSFFTQPPDVAKASAFTAGGARSSLAVVLIDE